MTKTYQTLPIVELQASATCHQPTQAAEIAHLEDPALHAMVDFKCVTPETINPDEVVDTALLRAKNCFYHALLVVNPEQQVLGLVSTEDLLGEKPLKAIQDRKLSRTDLNVQTVMIPRNEIVSLNIEDLRHAKVGQVVATLRTHKQHYALVIKTDEKTNVQTIHGLFSSALLSKQLSRDVMSDLSSAQSIAELQHNLHLND